jgi:hypothetical protein
MIIPLFPINILDTPRLSMAATYQLKGLDLFKRFIKGNNI